jgi:hypothetical protein
MQALSAQKNHDDCISCTLLCLIGAQIGQIWSTIALPERRCRRFERQNGRRPDGLTSSCPTSFSTSSLSKHPAKASLEQAVVPSTRRTLDLDFVRPGVRADAQNQHA